jgi:hypothetical protein
MIVKWQILSPLLFAAGLTAAGASLAADAATPMPVPSSGGVYQTTNPDGSIELTNLPSTEGQEPLIAAPTAAETPAVPAGVPPAATPRAAYVPAPAAPAPAAAASGQAESAPAEQPKDARELYRDRMLGGAKADGTPAPASNPAVSRRYKMMDKETFRNSVLPGLSETQPSPPADQPATAQ